MYRHQSWRQARLSGLSSRANIKKPPRSKTSAACGVKRGARTHACRAETRLGACAWTVASANKRRKKSRRGTHKCVRTLAPMGGPTSAADFHHDRWAEAHGDRTEIGRVHV